MLVEMIKHSIRAKLTLNKVCKWKTLLTLAGGVTVPLLFSVAICGTKKTSTTEISMDIRILFVQFED